MVCSIPFTGFLAIISTNSGPLAVYLTALRGVEVTRGLELKKPLLFLV
jgi:hypothetical protein